jgi:hypothetical protein
VSEPYLPHVSDDVFTLVLDLDETLIHFIDCENSNTARKGNLTSRTSKTKRSEDEEFGGHFLIRPGAREFLA